MEFVSSYLAFCSVDTWKGYISEQMEYKILNIFEIKLASFLVQTL